MLAVGVSPAAQLKAFLRAFWEFTNSDFFVGIVLRISRTRVFQSTHLTTLPAVFVTRKQPLEEM